MPGTVLWQQPQQTQLQPKTQRFQSASQSGRPDNTRTFFGGGGGSHPSDSDSANEVDVLLGGISRRNTLPQMGGSVRPSSGFSIGTACKFPSCPPLYTPNLTKVRHPLVRQPDDRVELLGRLDDHACSRTVLYSCSPCSKRLTPWHDYNEVRGACLPRVTQLADNSSHPSCPFPLSNVEITSRIISAYPQLCARPRRLAISLNNELGNKPRGRAVVVLQHL